MSQYGSAAHPAHTSAAPLQPLRPTQLRTPVPPQVAAHRAGARHRYALGHPGYWALGVAALLVGLLVGLVLSSLPIAALLPADTAGDGRAGAASTTWSATGG